MRKLEEGVPYCSLRAECKVCGGTLRVDCPSCRNVEAEAWLKKERDKLRKWVEKRRKYDKIVERKLLHGGTRHFELVFEIPKLKVGRVILDRHHLMHLYLDRLETLYYRFKEIMCLTDADMNPPIQVFIWNRQADQRRIAPHVTGTGGRGVTGTKLLGAHPVFTMCRGRGARNDRDIHRCVIHNVAHLLLSNIRPYVWLGKRKAGWIDAGVAHYFEFLFDGRCTNFCYQEQNTMVGFRGGKWRAWIRGKVAFGYGLPKFVSFYTKLTDELTPLEHALSFSYVDFLLARYGGRKFTRMVRGIMKKRPQREVIKEVYGFSVLEMEERWKKYVLETYPVREK